MGCGKEMPTHHLTMNTIDLGYVIPGAYSGLSWIRGCSSLCCTDQASVGALETSAPLAGCHTTYGDKKRSPKSFDSEDLK